MVLQTQFRIWFCRPSLEYGVADPVDNIVWRPSLEYGVADPVLNVVWQTQLRI